MLDQFQRQTPSLGLALVRGIPMLLLRQQTFKIYKTYEIRFCMIAFSLEICSQNTKKKKKIQAISIVIFRSVEEMIRLLPRVKLGARSA